MRAHRALPLVELLDDVRLQPLKVLLDLGTVLVLRAHVRQELLAPLAHHVDRRLQLLVVPSEVAQPVLVALDLHKREAR